MNSLIVIINIFVLFLFLGGWIFLLIAAWRSMKAMESIAYILNKTSKVFQNGNIATKKDR